jgi:hypothetical protein
VNEMATQFSLLIKSSLLGRYVTQPVTCRGQMNCDNRLSIEFCYHTRATRALSTVHFLNICFTLGRVRGEASSDQ